MEAYARAFFCNSANGNSVPSWSDDNGDIRRYLLLHQCLLWRGQDNPTHWRTNVGKDKTSYKPTLPYTCTIERDSDGRVLRQYAGPNCEPCPACAPGNGTCKTATFTGVSGKDLPMYGNNYCECDENHVGDSCQLQKCPLNRYPIARTKEQGGNFWQSSLGGSPCGVREGHGMCVMKTANVTQIRRNIDSPFVCQCENGYGGPGCGIALCAVPTVGPTPDTQVASVKFVNNSLVCSNHGTCQALNATTGRCLCDEGYTGAACQLFQCPTARAYGRGNSSLPELVCNGLKYGPGKLNGQSVCNNQNPFLPTFCDCMGAAPTRNRMDRWFGDACQYPVNLTCLDPQDTTTQRIWCNNAARGIEACRLPKDIAEQYRNNRAALNQFAPQCDCDSLENNDQTGLYCERSKCGVRIDAATGKRVPVEQTCNGYPGTPPTGARSPTGSCNVSTTGQMTFARCVCKPSIVFDDNRPGSMKRTLFYGEFCEKIAFGCTNPAKVEDVSWTMEKGVQMSESTYNARVCSGGPNEVRGVCGNWGDALAVPILGAGPERCRCLENFQGTFCQDDRGVCHPPCTPGLGTCVYKTQTEGGSRCECLGNEHIIWSSQGGSDVLQCNMNWCNATRGITGLFGDFCICPTGTSFSPVAATGVKPIKRDGTTLDQYWGCRRLCPASGPWNLECDGARAFGVANSPIACSTALPATSINALVATPSCICPLKQGASTVPFIGKDPFYVQFGSGESKMYFFKNPITGSCDSVCGNGAEMEWVGKAPYQFTCKCTNAARIKYCGGFKAPFFKEPMCNGRGKWDQTKKTCTCEGLYQPPFCEKSSCDNGDYSPTLGIKFCNCSYPYATSLDDKSPNFGKCISACPRGVPGVNAFKQRECQCPRGWQGKYCIDSQCQFGAICPDADLHPDQPACCCTTPLANGPFCTIDPRTACAHGTYRQQGSELPTCACDKFFTGARCDVDLCGIVGDHGVNTGAFDPVEKKCRCTPGYAAASDTGLCTVGLCGARGTVEQNIPGGFTCHCDPPDVYDAASSKCVNRACVHGTQTTGLDGKKIVCLCDSGYEGSDCSQAICKGERIVYDAVANTCECIYPFVDAPLCQHNMCGRGANFTHPVVQINTPGNPVEYECLCDESRGFRLGQSPLLTNPIMMRAAMAETPEVNEAQVLAFALSRGDAPDVCIVDCSDEGTASSTAYECNCKPTFMPPTCKYKISDTCPDCPKPLVEQQGYSARTFWISVLTPSITLALVAIAASLGVYFTMKSPSQPALQASAQPGERQRLLHSMPPL